jgi:citrate lyase beta subunit
VAVQHFDFLTEEQRESLFAVPPQPVRRRGDGAQLALALGATFYSPGTRTTLADDARRAAGIGTTSQVWCLEDSIPHEAVPQAQANVVAALRSLRRRDRLPLLFVRVRTPEQVVEVTAQAGEAAAHLTGFVLPKFRPGPEGEAWLQAVEQAGALAGIRLYAMPVLEHEDLAWKESRAEHLVAVRALLDSRRRDVLAVRVGGTDLCGLFGLRRDRDTTIWDVALVRDMLADVLNIFARRGDYVVSGPVWEHFSGNDRLFKSQLRQTPFENTRSLRLHSQLVRDDVDELLREVALDRANGFSGKTVIHPTHVSVVNALHAVTREEYDDALVVLAGRESGGVVRSPSGGKMNELGPHALWAEQVSARAAVYGVLAEPDGVVALLDHGWRAAQAAYGQGMGWTGAPRPLPVM